MRVCKICFNLIIFLFAFVLLNAQNDNKAQKDSLLNRMTDIETKLKEFSSKDTTIGFSAPLKIDTTYAYKIHKVNLQPLRDDNGLLIVTPDWTPFSDNISFRDTVIFEPAFLPVMFEGKILPSKLDFIPKDTLAQQNAPFHLISPDSTFAPMLTRIQQIEDMRKYYYVNNPQKIRLNALGFKGVSVIEEKEVERRNPFKDLISADSPIEFTTPEIEKIRIKPVYWLKNGEHRLQLSYNTYSDKWGGDNNFDLFSHQKFDINYKKKKIRFNNLIEWRLQLKQLVSVEDKDREENKNKGKINVIEDHLRTYSTFSIEAFYKRWFYSTNLEMKTPVLDKKTIEANRQLQRSFLSPFELNLGLGMRYEVENTSEKNKHRKFRLSADLSALSINYKYVRHDSIPVASFGIEEGDRAKTEYGSTYNVNFSYSHNNFTKFSSRLKYFTNYEKVYAEWENSVDFAINSYFATTIYFYMKYDDGVPEANKNNDKRWGYFNYNTMLRFGLTYTW